METGRQEQTQRPLRERLEKELGALEQLAVCRAPASQHAPAAKFSRG